jgi:hypothetical protein
MDDNKIKEVRFDETDWLYENQEWLEREHAGKWVAIKGKALLAVGDSLAAVMEEADAKGVEMPLVTVIRRREPGVWLVPTFRWISTSNTDTNRSL